jgi:hypothetical protein
MEKAKEEIDVSGIVHEWMKNKLPNVQIERVDMRVPSDISAARFAGKLSQAYPGGWESVSDADHDALYAAVEKHLGRGTPKRDTVDSYGREHELDILERAFTAAFFGDAHIRLFQYIQLCWKRYVMQGMRFCYPYIAIMQSSGFGKSRVLRECALHMGHAINRTNPDHERYHLLYVCVRNARDSTGFPVETVRLREHLFPRVDEDQPTDQLVHAMTRKLVQHFDFVMQAPDASVVDEQLLQLFTRNPAAQDPFCKPPSGSRPRRTKSHEKTRVLVIAIDEARALLPTKLYAENIGWFRCFRRALYQANDVLRTAYGDRSGIFGIVVDTNSSASGFAPSAELDPSKRTTDRALFPPFVLTDTVDVFLKQSKQRSTMELEYLYKQRVLAAVANAAPPDASAALNTSWEELSTLGRPLWGSRKWKQWELIALAAEKLLGGAGGATLAKGTLVKGLDAVASVMCRLGIRPYMSTPLATQVITDYMAVLSYATRERERCFVSYSSDPILTLGAAKVWYSGEGTTRGGCNLSTYILPQLKTALRHEVLDTSGDMGGIVARIALLLAMDACAVLKTGDESMRWLGAGEFYSVPTFLQAMAGTAAGVEGVTATTLDEVRLQMEARWGSCYVSFTHFVQLSEEPNETCLWGLLGRRAAAILPRGHHGVDFIIPICRNDVSSRKRKASAASESESEAEKTPPIVSAILVRVKNHEQGCSSVVKAVAKNMDPAAVFSKANPLHRIAPGNVLRILFSPQEPRPRHVYVEDPREPGSYALHVLGFESWSSLPLKRTSGKAVTVVSPAVASELSEMLGPWWRGAEMVKGALEEGWRDDRIESDITLMATALQPLGDVLVLNER